MPPVYPLIVAVLFHFFGVHTPASILAVHVFDCLINALACIPIFLMARRSFGERAGWWAAWGWAIFPYGIYFSAAWAWSTHLLLLCLCWLLVSGAAHGAVSATCVCGLDSAFSPGLQGSPSPLSWL